ncbi:MAG: glycosyltransferase family 2 protein [Acidobacteriota bacterium]
MRPVVLVIPNWNGEGHLRRLFPTIAPQTLQPARVLVVDNGSTDGSADYARSQGAEVLQLDRNLGFAAAVNRGIAATAEPLVGILNNDVTLDPRYWEELANAMGSGVSFATGKIYQPGGNNVLDGTWDLLTRSALAVRCGNGLPDGEIWDEPREIAMAPLTAALFDRRVFQTVGGLDERFESYLEDVDLGLRCALLGLKGQYAPKAKAEHWGSGTLGVWHARTVRLISRNQVYVVAKYFPRGWMGRLGRPVVVGQVLWGLAALKRGRSVSWLIGKVEGLWRYRSLRKSARVSRSGDVAGLLLKFERELIDLQMKTGTDRFWSWYFRWTKG